MVKFPTQNREKSMPSCPSILKAEISPFGADGHIRKWAEIEFEVIDRALFDSGGNVRAVCTTLGIGRSTIYRRMGSWRSAQMAAGSCPGT